MDQNQITIARNYLAGYNGRLTLDTLPVRSAVQLQTLVEEDPRVPEYVPDSANTATSMESSSSSRIRRCTNVTAADGAPLESWSSAHAYAVAA